MDRFRQKSKKEKPLKYVGKDQSPLFITDVKTIKENIKIKEILRTVKMNSSMRIKAPRGSKVMQNKDFIDNEDIFEGDSNGENTMEPPNATNADVVVNSNVEINENSSDDETEETVTKSKEENDEMIEEFYDNNSSVDTTIPESIIVPDGLLDYVPINEEDKQNVTGIPDVKIDLPAPSECSHVKTRDRKLSLDQTMLSRREGLSQSELDLNSIGKSPLERKSSFFRKTMDSFLKNTTEIFKRQSISKSQSIQRRGSMSMSLQSLNENTACNGDYGELLHKHQEELQGSASSLRSSLTPARSVSSMSKSHSERTLPDPHSKGSSLAGSHQALTGSQPLGDTSSHSIPALNEAYIQESLLNSRAISMSSGLDSAHGQRHRKSRSNRVTWLVSEELTNYYRRVIQDEKSRELNSFHSYQDYSTITENNFNGPKTDSKGRRLSYQRAVSGEDPRYHDSTHRRKQLIPENSEIVYDLGELLAAYTRNGVPELQGFCIADITEDAFRLLKWAEQANHLEEFFDWKKLPASEESRQAVIKELIHTEADYIRHLRAIVEVFIATAHALQDAGKLLDIDTAKLFTNIPDVLNASLYFWQATIYPMVAESVQKKTPFNSETMSPGFMNFEDMFEPYEKYFTQQTKALDYLRSLSNNPDFMAYLTWCHSQKTCNRLQLSDIMVKPMQRLTKYSLILRRLITHTDTEPHRTSLIAMETCSKNYVQDINRSIRQKQELEKLEKLCNTVETYEIEYKDEELDRCFRVYSHINLKAPMMDCTLDHSRTLIHFGDLRYKDHLKEMEVRVFLLTDMILVCKKLSKGSLYPYKMIRPKYMIDKLVTFSRPSSRNPKEIASLVFVSLDDVGSATYAFSLTESSKEPNAQGTLKTWEQKLRESRLTYELGMWLARNPARDVSDIDPDAVYDSSLNIPTLRTGGKLTLDELNIERDARERVVSMLHRSKNSSTEAEASQASMPTDSFDEPPPGLSNLRYPMKRASTGGSSRMSRLSSFQKSTSATSHDEPQPGPSRYQYTAGSSVEHVIPPLNPEDGMTSITVNVVSECETETVVDAQQAQPQPEVQAQQPQPELQSQQQEPQELQLQQQEQLPQQPQIQQQPQPQPQPQQPQPQPQLPPQPPVVVLQQSSPHKMLMPSRSSSTSRNTLRVQPQNVVLALVHSLPDLTFDTSPTPPRPQQSPATPTASDKLYQSHQELLLRNRLSAQQHQHYLTPDHRGTSYPPPSPTRASLKRGLAFSYSFKNPPLSKMGHVNSQTQLNAEAGPSTSQGSKGEKGPTPSTSAAKPDKKTKNVSGRTKGRSVSPSSRKEDKSD